MRATFPGPPRAISMILGSLAAIGLLVWMLVPDARPRAQHEASPLVLYAAAGLMKPLTVIAAAYQKETGERVQIEPGPSGKLLSQIQVSPGRAHLFAAADVSYLTAARRKGVVAEILPIAHMRPALVVAAGNPKGVRGPNDLLRPDIRVALANPELASVGRTAKQILSKSGRWAALEARSRGHHPGLSFVGTVTEAAQAVKLGAADASIVWDSIAEQFSLHTVASEIFDQPQQLAIGVVSPNERVTAALRFARYTSASNRGLLTWRKHGFTPISDADRWESSPRVRLMAGAMLKSAIEEPLRRFEEREGVSVQRVYNECGVLVAQMKTGDRPDAYFACDVSFMRQVKERFGPPVMIARNPIVLVVPKGNPRHLESLGDLAQPGLRVGLGHPEKSALGSLTDRLLRDLGLRDAVYGSGRTVFHADAGHMLVNQMRTGALDAIVVYRSNVTAAASGVGTPIEALTLPHPGAMAAQPFAIERGNPHPQLTGRMMEAILAERDRFLELGFQWAHAPAPPVAP